MCIQDLHCQTRSDPITRSQLHPNMTYGLGSESHVSKVRLANETHVSVVLQAAVANCPAYRGRLVEDSSRQDPAVDVASQS